MKLKDTRSEDARQRVVVTFLDLAIRKPDRYWHVPNGGGRGAPRIGKDGKRKAPVAAAILKAQGVKTGVHDLHFIWASGGARQFPNFGTIEMKDGTGTMSDEQKTFARDMEAIGWPTELARTVEDVERILRSWGVTLHASVLPSGVFKTAARG